MILKLHAYLLTWNSPTAWNVQTVLMFGSKQKISLVYARDKKVYIGPLSNWVKRLYPGLDYLCLVYNWGKKVDIGSVYTCV